MKRKVLSEVRQLTAGDVIGPEQQQELIEYFVAHGFDKKQAEARVEHLMGYTEWQLDADVRIAHRFAELMKERGASGGQPLREVISEEESLAIIEEEWARARQHAPDLN